MNKAYYKFRNKPNASLISMLQRFSDISVVFLGLYLTFLINSKHFGYNQLLVSLIVITIFQMIGGITDFYRSWRGVDLTSELILVLKNWTLSIIITAGILSYSKVLAISLDMISIWYVITILGVFFFRIMIRYSAMFFRKLGYNTRNIAIAGSMPAGIRLAKSFQNEPWLGFIVVGFYDDKKPISNTDDIIYKGNYNQLICDAKSRKIDKIYLAMGMSDELIMTNLVEKLKDTTCSVILIPDIFTFNILQSRTEEVNGVPVVPLFDTPINGINRIIKRCEDVFLSLFILILISPLLILIALLIKSTSKGPVIFKQIRYGIDGKPILVWKFRSMSVMENDEKVIQATRNDVRITKVGKVLRKTSLDELPQFLNVLGGTMSIVGPRPHAVTHNEQYRTIIDGYMLRHKVKPGITGLAQVKGWRGETDTIEKMERRIECDLQYIREWSLYLDLKIILLTLFKGFMGKSAY